jgi:ferredoxin
MKAIIDKETCIGCGLCVDICPEVFELNADGKAEAKVDPIPADSESAATDAAEQCPVNAITIQK